MYMYEHLFFNKNINMVLSGNIANLRHLADQIV